MGEYLSWALRFLCIAVAALQVVGGVWCWVELRKKWQGTPELYGIDWLDIVFRVESVFGVTLAVDDFANWSSDAREELTAGQLWEVIARKLRTIGAVVPTDGLASLAVVLSDALSVRPDRIAAESRLKTDLGMFDGWD